MFHYYINYIITYNLIRLDYLYYLLYLSYLIYKRSYYISYYIKYICSELNPRPLNGPS